MSIREVTVELDLTDEEVQSIQNYDYTLKEFAEAAVEFVILAKKYLPKESAALSASIQLREALEETEDEC